jgi:hypothetical protein
MTHRRERSIRRRERRERRSEEFRLREQQGLSSLGTEEYSSSGEEEEESDGGRAPPERWEPSPPRLEPRRRRKRRRLGRAQEPHRRATYEGGDARRGDTGARRRDGRGCGGGHTGGGDSVRRALEEKEARIFLPEVGDYFPLIARFRLARA